VASWLLHTELHCAARRHPAEIGLVAVGTLLDAVTWSTSRAVTCSPRAACRVG